MYLYINGRYVRDPVMRRGVLEGYRDHLPRGRYPVVVLNLRLPTNDVDINVHPAKIEVRFQNPRAVGHALAEGLSQRLSGGDVRRTETPSDHAVGGPLFEAAEVALPLRKPRNLPTPVYLEKELPRAHPDDDERWREPPMIAAEPTDSAPTDDEPAPSPGGPRYGDLVVIGLLADRWALCEEDGDLVVVDPVAAREQLAFVSLQRSPGNALGQQQRLLTPRRVELSVSRADRIEAVREALEDLGIALDRFSPTSWAVRALPLALVDVDLDGLLVEIAGAPPSGLYAVVAARAARVEGGELDVYEVRTLLASLDDAGQVPGGPVALRISPRELLERFRRSRES
jgi:DNA mismatch repair protein MutL